MQTLKDAHAVGNYRYWLTRTWNTKLPRCTFVGLNPSTADAWLDDPTIRKCVGFAQRWGMGSLLMLNVFTFRTTDPRVLSNCVHPDMGSYEEYRRAIDTVQHGELTVCCWGSTLVRGFEHRYREMILALRLRGAKLRALQLNKSGSPKHPLYVSYTKKLVHYRGVNLGAVT